MSRFRRPTFSPSFTQNSSPSITKPNFFPFLNGPQNCGTKCMAYQKSHQEDIHGLTESAKHRQHFTFTRVRYTSLTNTISHDNNNHCTSTSTSWRSDGPPSCLGGSSHGWVPSQNPQYTRAHFGVEAVGCSLAFQHTTMSPRKRNTITTTREHVASKNSSVYRKTRNGSANDGLTPYHLLPPRP